MRDTWKMDDSLNRADPIGEDDSEVTMVMNDGLIPALPTELIIDVVSRLSGKDACKLKVLSKQWLSFISYDSEFKRLHRLRARQRPSFLVHTKTINDRTSPVLFFADVIPPLAPPMTGEVEDFSCRRLIFKFDFRLNFECGELVASCRDLMCFFSGRVIHVYSPSTNQYLCFDTMVTVPNHALCRIAIVYVASMKLYKIVKLEVPESPLSRATIRFYALTLEDEEDEPQCERGRRCDVDEHHTSAWEFISEHAISSTVHVKMGRNLIGVGGVVYVIVRFPGNPEDVEERQVLSLGFEENTDERIHNFKMFSLPQAGCDGRKCRACSLTPELSEVKDLLCFPHTNTSSIDLWLLKDRYTCIWFKGYTISYTTSPGSIIGLLAYFPYPTTTVYDDADAGAGLFLFVSGYQYIQYDIRTKESRLLSHESCIPKFHVFSDNLYSLKNGLSCNRMPRPSPPSTLLKSSLSHDKVQHTIDQMRVEPDWEAIRRNPDLCAQFLVPIMVRPPRARENGEVPRHWLRDGISAFAQRSSHLVRRPLSPPTRVLVIYQHDSKDLDTLHTVFRERKGFLCVRPTDNNPVVEFGTELHAFLALKHVQEMHGFDAGFASRECGRRLTLEGIVRNFFLDPRVAKTWSDFERHAETLTTWSASEDKFLLDLFEDQRIIHRLFR